MKINNLNFKNEITDPYGLAPIEMKRLGQIVLIAGKNGAGKTRFLNMLKKQIQEYPTQAQIAEIESSIFSYESNKTTYTHKLQYLKFELVRTKKDSQDHNILSNDINTFSRSLEHSELQLQALNLSKISLDRISFIPSKEIHHLVSFVPKKVALTDSYDMSIKKANEHAQYIYKLGTDHISAGTISAIEQIIRRYINATHPNGSDLSVSEVDKEKYIREYKRLKEYIKIFLNADLTRNEDGSAVLFGKRIGEAQLSDGQSILLQFCMAIYAQEASLKDLIIIMDEPENHLHPGALVDVLDKIIANVTEGQLWIATHSIHILAHFDPSYIYYMKDGHLSYAGKITWEVLNSLIGSEKQIDELSNFLSLPAEFAMQTFAYQSLFFPSVVFTGPDDPQVRQIESIIQQRAKTGNTLKVLDFGIGKGRLLASIFENAKLENKNIFEWLDLYGFDVDVSNKDLCMKIFEDAYGSAEGRYFNDEKLMLSKISKESVDIIIMCNVFHEIDPKHWLHLFTNILSPFSLLKPDGFLLLVEDQFLAVGEKAHPKGFLVFDELEFRTLFKAETSDEFKSTDYRGDGRLKAHYIPKKYLGRIDSVSRKEALKVLQEHSKREIRSLREKQATYQNGHLHAFWTQQLANTMLALEEL